MYFHFIYQLCVLCFTVTVAQDVTSLLGHKKRFGAGRLSEEIVQTRYEFPEVHDFFKNYVWNSKPLKMSGVLFNSAPYKKWTDEYFLSLDLNDQEDVTVETKKKENRKQPAMAMDFREFVRIYNTTDNYMVQDVPKFLRKDVVLPYPLQCDQIYNGNIVQSIMWFSSGGTKSVVHTDSVENINCLYHGEKEFIFVNPHKFGDKVDLDHPEGAYSDIDVDVVDYNKYPGLAEVEYMFVNVSAGDCVYIPFKWIHQVRSFNRNIAVNIWWDHYASEKLDLDMCPHAAPDPSLTLDKITFQGLGQHSLSVPAIRDFFLELTKKGPVAAEDFYKTMVEDIPVFQEDGGKGHERYLRKIAGRLDTDGDEKLSPMEIKEATEQDWEYVQDQINTLEDIAEELETKWSELNKAPVEELYERYAQQEEEVDGAQQEKNDVKQEVVMQQEEKMPSGKKVYTNSDDNEYDIKLEATDQDGKIKGNLHKEDEAVYLEYDSEFEDDLDLRVWDYESDHYTNSVDGMMIEDHDEL